jgi:hypothetical protein
MTQIGVMIDQCEAALKQRAVSKPEEALFNSQSYGQMLSTVAADGKAEVAVFTGLAKLEGEKVVFGRIGAAQTYQNLKGNPHGVFTAVGPSNDPTKYAFITIVVYLREDHTDGPAIESLRASIGSAVTNCMVFAVEKVVVVHLPKPKTA